MTSSALNPVFLSIEEVLEIHADQITRYGGTLGVRDEGLLRSALAQPESRFGDEFLHGSLETMAAAYLFQWVKNHPFLDGNKRTGAACGLIFLEINGLELDPALDFPENDFEQTRLETIVLSVIAGQITKDGLADVFTKYVRPLLE